MGKITRIDRELKYKGSVLEIYCDTIKTVDGNIAKWDYIEHSSAAGVLPVLDNGNIVLVKQYRNSLDRDTYEIPAGGVEKDETTKQAAIRELQEEAGFVSENVELLIKAATAVAYSNEIVDIYIAKNLTKTKQHLDRDEYIEVVEFTKDDLKKMITEGKLQDSKTIAAVMTYLVQN